MLQVEMRWVVMAWYGDEWHLLGKYCWPGATQNEPKIRTFRTRADAREAKNRLGNYYSSRVRKVELVVYET